MLENERREQLIAVAGEMFLQKGYHATTMDAVAKSAGMSKKTVYQIFAAKSELFDALLIDWRGPSTIPVEIDGRSPREVLIGLLYRLVNFELSERQISITRLLIAEAQRSEDVALALERQCIGRGTGGCWSGGWPPSRHAGHSRSMTRRTLQACCSSQPPAITC